MGAFRLRCDQKGFREFGESLKRIFLLLLPCLVVVGTFVWPMVSVFPFTLRLRDGTLSIQNYVEAFTKWTYINTYINTFRLALTVTFICLFLAYPASLFMMQMKSKLLKTLAYLIVLSPILTTEVVRSYGWITLLSDNGLVNRLLLFLHVTQQPIRFLWTFEMVVLAVVHVLLPFMILPLLSSLQDTNPSLKLAAQNLGASPIQTFLRITLPLSAPGAVVGCTFVFMLSLASYITPVLVGGPFQPLTGIMIYSKTQTFNLPFGAALSYVLLMLVFLSLMVVNRVTRSVLRRVTLTG